MDKQPRYQELNLEGCRHLVAAVIENAFEDYRKYVSLGVVKGLELNEAAWKKTQVQKGNHVTTVWLLKDGDVTRRNQQVNRHNVRQLLNFLKEHMDTWIDKSGMDLDGGRLRTALVASGSKKPDNPSPYRSFQVQESTEAVAA